MTPEEKAFFSALFWAVYHLGCGAGRMGTDSLDALRDSYDKAFPIKED